MKPSPALLDRLSRSRLNPRWAGASVGIGERRSKSKGAGMEFADHRAYQPGDDLRHLDLHLYARLGESFVRQYEVHRQLPIFIILDASRSMSHGEGARYRFARELAALIGFVGLAGGDQVRLAIGRSGAVEWSQRLHGPTRAQEIFDWLERAPGEGGSFTGCLPDAARDMPEKGLSIVISDFWDVPPRELKALAAGGQEIWAVHVASREEIDPEILGEGAARFVDAETGEEVELDLTPEMIERFRRGFESWRGELRGEVEALGGRYLMLASDARLETLFLEDWRRMGLLA